MSATVACIHTVIPLIDLFRRMAAKKAPQLRMLHLLDEAVFARIRRRDCLAPEDVERLVSHIRTARDAGATAVLVTCSTLSPLVDDLPEDLRPGVLKVDDALMREAVRRPGKVLVAATNFATLEPSRRTLVQAGAPADTETVLIPDAFDAFLRDDFDTHDGLLLEGLIALKDRADTIVLAQASMARVMDQLPDDVRPKVLSSPDLAINALVEMACPQ
jgi:aspartate/glutamate racemase